MPRVKGYLEIVDGSGYPDQGLPSRERPVDPGYGFPLPPVVDNKPPSGPPGHPGHPLPPTYPTDPDYGLPTPPGIWPNPPVPPEVSEPVFPTLPIYIAPPDVELPPGAVWPPLPPILDGKFVAFVWVVGVGYRWVVIDTTAQVEPPIAPTPSPK